MRIQKSSPYANQLIDNLIKAAEACDPTAVNDFFSIAIEANLSHLELISAQLSGIDSLKRTNAILAGSILLGLFNHFAARKLRDGLGVHEVDPG